MTKKLLSAALVGLLSLAGCGDDDDNGGGGPDLTTPAGINAYLNGKTLLMTGANIPSHPNGLNEDVNFGAATQCYVSTQIQTGTNWVVTSQLATLEGAPNTFDVGTCNHAVPFGTPLTFTSTNVLIENVEGNGDCFDVTATYPGFAQEGRAAFNAGATELRMELFFAGATGHRCADGDVGGGNAITLSTGAAFTGDAVQTYVID
jgi:hypothetical protein